jgi:uncharacterized FlgJ-related protein
LERVNIEKREVNVSVNPNFYNYDCVKKTKKLFLEECEVTIRKRKDSIEVKLKPKSKKIDREILGYEFYNHLLNTLKEMRTGV